MFAAKKRYQIEKLAEEWQFVNKKYAVYEEMLNKMKRKLSMEERAGIKILFNKLKNYYPQKAIIHSSDTAKKFPLAYEDDYIRVFLVDDYNAVVEFIVNRQYVKMSYSDVADYITFDMAFKWAHDTCMKMNIISEEMYKEYKYKKQQSRDTRNKIGYLISSFFG